MAETPNTETAPPPPHPIDAVNAELPADLARSRFGKWRVLSLTLVYAAMIIHVVHWKVSGETMAPLELSEIMKALELGVISPGVIFIGVMLIGSAVFGRFFCSWGCHMLALQDLFHWVLKRMRIRPRPVRSRVLLLVPLAAALYMFLWPQIDRLWSGEELPEATSRFVTTDFWRDLPGPVVITLTVLVCGLLVVYFFGGRGFCTYGCPYGALFGVMDRFAPGRIRNTGTCIQCGKCTAICTSGVRVHEEVEAYGGVVDPRCMKDLDCVSVCPQNALHFGFGVPTLARPTATAGTGFRIWEELTLVAVFAGALFTWPLVIRDVSAIGALALSILTALAFVAALRFLRRRRAESAVAPSSTPKPRYDFSGKEEIAMAVLLVLALLTWRNLYHRLPFLMSLGLAAITAYVAITFFRLLRSSRLRLNRYRLKADGRLTRAGRIFVAAAAPFLLFTVHSGFVQCSRRLGDQAWEQAFATNARTVASTTARRAAMTAGLKWYQRRHRWGLWSTTTLEYRLGVLSAGLERHAEAEEYLVHAVTLSPGFPEAHLALARTLEKRGNVARAADHLERVLAMRAPHAEHAPRYAHLHSQAHAALGRLLFRDGASRRDPAEQRDRFRRARQQLEESLEMEPTNVEALLALGLLEANSGSRDLDRATARFEAALEANPQAAEAWSNLGDVLVARERPAEAVSRYERALEIAPDLPGLRFKLGFIQLGLGRVSEAVEHLRIAARQSPLDPNPHHALGQALRRAGRPAEAEQHLMRARALLGGR